MKLNQSNLHSAIRS